MTENKTRLAVVAERQGIHFIATSHPHTEVTKLLCPHHEGAGAPHPIRAGGPDLWYQMALVDITVEQSLMGLCDRERRTRY